MADITIVESSKMPMNVSLGGGRILGKTLLNQEVDGVRLRVVTGECIPGADSGEHGAAYV